MKNVKIKIILGLVLAISTSHMAFAKVDCDGAEKAKCRRLKDILSKWPSSEIEGLNFTIIEKIAKSKDAANSDENDFGTTLQKNSTAGKTTTDEAAEAGLCRYDEESEVVEIDRQVLEFSDFGLSNCLSAGIAGALYSKVEDKWLSKLEENEAWVVRGGKAVKVSVGVGSKKLTKLEESSAQMLWMSFASREFMKVFEKNSVGTDTQSSHSQARSIASVESNDELGQTVRELAGLK